MDAELVNKLLALNREFYHTFAEQFSRSRSAERVNVEPIKPYLFEGARVLEVGCGNGRLAERLDRDGYRLSYLGLDVTPGLIEIANVRKAHLRHIIAEFLIADVASRGWAEFPGTPFDLALALAVLHHVPGLALRCRVLRDLHTQLRSNGILVMSNWQFTRNARLRKKIVSWKTLDIDEHELEPGDMLLDWKRGGTGYRYVHELSEAEVRTLAEQSGFEVLAQFYAEADLNLWSVLRKG